jgi:hypothetical protein
MNKLLAFLLIILSAIFYGFIFAFFTMWLWNWLMPDIFGLKEISFMQAFGINILSGILFRSSFTYKNDD